MYPGCGNVNCVKGGAGDTLHKRMLLVILCLGDLTAYAMTYFSFMEEEPFQLTKAFSSRIILCHSYHSCLDHVVLYAVRNKTV